MRIKNPLPLALSTVLVASASQFSIMAVNINGVELTKPSQVDESVWEDVVKFLKDLIGKEKIRVSIYLPEDPDSFNGHTTGRPLDTRYYAVMLNFDGKENKFPKNYGENGDITLTPEEGFFACRFRFDFLQEKLMKSTRNCQWLFEQYGSRNYVDFMDSRFGQLFRRTKIEGPLFERESDHISEEEAPASREVALKICRMVIRQAIMRKFSMHMKKSLIYYLDAIDYLIDNGKLFRYEMMGELGIDWDSVD